MRKSEQAFLRGHHEFRYFTLIRVDGVRAFIALTPPSHIIRKKILYDKRYGSLYGREQPQAFSLTSICRVVNILICIYLRTVIAIRADYHIIGASYYGL